MAAVDDDSEWEYEYDENETEDFYITLDLTTHVPPQAANEKKNKANKSTKTTRGSNKSLANAPGSTQLATRQSPDPDHEDGAPSVPLALAADRMQIVDLHGDNPLVSFNNALYSCQWATDLGTSMYLAPPGPDIDTEHPPLRSTPSFDLLGTGSARLIAAPATIKPRIAPLQSGPFSHESTPGGLFSTKEGDIIRHTDSQGLRIELPSTASALKVSQARFLERLSAIKARRGDKDVVPVTNVKIYRPPEGWEAERDEWIAKETSMSEKNRLEAELRMTKTTGRANMASTPFEDGQSPADSEEPAYGEPAPDNLSDQDLDSPDPNRIVLASQIPRKRKTRGGPRGGAPSGKKLRQSLGLPEARRHKRGPGRPRKIRLDSEMDDDGDARVAESASSQQGGAGPSTMNTQDGNDELIANE